MTAPAFVVLCVWLSTVSQVDVRLKGGRASNFESLLITDIGRIIMEMAMT